MSAMPDSFLESDHAALGKLFAEFQARLEAPEAARAFELLDLIWARLAIHIRAEHLCLFPAILNAPARKFTGTNGTPQPEEAHEAIRLLRSDHDFFMHEMASGVNTLRRLKDSSNPLSAEVEEVRERVAGVCRRLEEHNRVEEQEVYTWITLLLDEGERSELMSRIRREFEKHPPRFKGRMFATDSDPRAESIES